MDMQTYIKSLATYRYLDYYRQEWIQARCIVVERGEKTSVIALLDFGPRGRKPGDMMRVHNKSIHYQEQEKREEELEPEWHKYTDI